VKKLRKLAAVMLVVLMLCQMLPLPFASALANGATSIVDLKTNYQIEPLGIDTVSPTFSWQMSSSLVGQMQSAYQIVVRENSASGPVAWDSGKQDSGISVAIAYGSTGQAEALQGQKKYVWTVTVWDMDYVVHTAQSFFETSANWGDAEWITIENYAEPMRSLLFRTEQPLTSSQRVASARLYITGLGAYEAYINGREVQGEVNSILAPGWTDYSSYIHYQTYDVTDYLTAGDHTVTLGAIVGSGWYGSAVVDPTAIGYNTVIGQSDLLERCLLAKMAITYEDGSTQEFVTDTDNWRVSSISPYVQDGVYEGETYDGRIAKNIEGWNDAGYNVDLWASPVALTYRGKVIASSAGIIYDYREIPMKSAYTYNESTDIIGVGGTYAMGEIDFSKAVSYSAGETVSLKAGDTLIADFGQNAAATAAFQVFAPAGTKITMLPCEILSDGKDGIYTKGTRFPGALEAPGYGHGRFIYTTTGDGIESHRAQFHFVGYQYLEIRADQDVMFLSLSSIAVSSVGKETGFVETSNSMINQFISNSKWSQVSNYCSVPTDCPQREYYGWSGDAQLFAESAMYHFDSAVLLGNYIDIMDDYYHTYSNYGNIMPMNVNSFFTNMINAGWSDAGIIIPWVFYQQTGDLSHAKRYWPQMCRFADRIYSGNHQFSLGDWNGVPGESATSNYVMSCFNITDQILMSKMARALGYESDASKYAANAETKRRQAIDRYIDTDGNVLCATMDGPRDVMGNVCVDNPQTALSWALKLELYDTEAQKQAIAAKLAASVRNENQSISTIRGENTLGSGFLGVNVLLPALSESGNCVTAYNLMLNDDLYTFLYAVACGATTIWEDWDIWMPDRGYKNSIVSHNHYSYGAASEWVYEYLLGIQKDEDNPGFKHFILQPQLDTSLSFANGSYKSYYGEIVTSWTANNGDLTAYQCTVPANTTATLYLPVDDADMDNFNQIYGVNYLGMDKHNGVDCAKLSLLSGGYSFDVTASGLVASRDAAYFAPVQAEINSVATVGVNTPASFTVSLNNAKDAGVVTLEFTADSRFLDLTVATALNGFSILDQLSWEYIGGQMWKGAVKLYNPGFVQTNAPIDVLEISGTALSLLGNTTVTLTDIVVTGGVDGFAGTLPSVIVKAGAETSIVSKTVFSKYDLNHDGRIDELDLAIVVYYYLANDLEADWDVVKFDIASAKDCDVALNGRVDLADMIEVIANYCDSY